MDSKDKQPFLSGAAKQTDNQPQPILLWLQRYFYYLIILQIVIILILGYWLVLRPKINTVFKSEAQVTLAEQAAQVKLANYEQKIKELRTIKDSYDNLSAQDKEKIAAALPSQPEERELMAQINKIVVANGLILKSLNLEENKGESAAALAGGVPIIGEPEPKTSAKFKKTAINFEARGATYSALKSLLSGLENNWRLIDVQSVKYNPQDETVAVELVAYYLPN
ncbi:MAG: hypothetical protein WCV41_01695 [Patescibacteria group bacterium]